MNGKRASVTRILTLAGLLSLAALTGLAPLAGCADEGPGTSTELTKPGDGFFEGSATRGTLH